MMGTVIGGNSHCRLDSSNAISSEGGRSVCPDPDFRLVAAVAGAAFSAIVVLAAMATFSPSTAPAAWVAIPAVSSVAGAFCGVAVAMFRRR